MVNVVASLRINSFKGLLTAGRRIGVDFENMIDGGAASGATAKEMLPSLTPGHNVYAFEPFPGNHRFFDAIDPRIKLVPKALGSAAGKHLFRVPSTIKADSDWGRRGMAGSSSVGYLVKERLRGAGGDYLEVDCVRGDEEVGQFGSFGFVKLDLQGGELEALEGLSGLLANVKLMIVEYSSPDGILDFLERTEFEVYDTEFMFMSELKQEFLEDFEVSREKITISTGASAWYGYRKKTWDDYVATYKRFRRLGLVQTDMVCVARSFREPFARILADLGLERGG